MMEEGASGRKVVRLTQLLPATPEEVFDAWTDAESLKEWLCPGATTVVTAELDVRVGGNFLIVMQAADGDYTHTGEYREIRRPERLVFTWRSTLTNDEETLVTVELYPKGEEGEETELVLIHELLPDESSAEEHANGWRSIAAKLEKYLRDKGQPI
ncbi:MAG: SRPBCC domain-containing protein [Acidobacteria bacterium]|nr:SRPBCC domain-containing protein [Acidobacteriota bacterium]